MIICTGIMTAADCVDVTIIVQVVESVVAGTWSTTVVFTITAKKYYLLVILCTPHIDMLCLRLIACTNSRAV